MRMIFPALAVVALLSCNAPVHADDADLAASAQAVLKKYCYRCHGVEQKVAGYNLLSRENLVQLRGDDDYRYAYINIEKPEASLIWERALTEDADMPPSGDMPSEAERELLQRWVRAGAPFPERERQPFVSRRQILQAMRDFLFKADADQRANLRFFSFDHLQNNYDKVKRDDMRLYRAALSKAMNSLSRKPQVVVPQEVPGSDGCLLVVDISRLGWDPFNQWLAVLRQYPYGLTYDEVRDNELQQLAKDIKLLSGTPLPYVRADWFVVFATQPPLYNTLLELPDSAAALEHELGVNRRQNILTAAYPDIARAGFGTSGVSRQNRLVERHQMPRGGAYWISYDFKPRKARGDLLRFPLGPRFDGNPHQRQAFDHDGGEIIFNLPNGLQGYMLVLGDDTRLDGPGPADVVFDSNAVTGTPAIFNGISCMHCHKHGMITKFRDEIRGAQSVRGQLADEVERLYPKPEQMNRLVQEDQQRFLAALEKTIGPFLQVEDDAKRPITEFPEPVGRVAAMYLADLGPNEVALELGFESPKQLTDKLTRELLRLGLGTLAQDPPGTVKREHWETLQGTSLFHDVAVELGLGKPLIP